MKPFALVTGASSGIGEAFASTLASRGQSLVLVARSEGKLALLRETLLRAHPDIEIVVLPRDLSEPGAAASLYAETARRGIPIDLLINNAGFGAFGDFAQLDLARQSEMVRLNVLALVELCGLYLPEMRRLRRGAVLNIASTAAFFPGPFFATYAATKTFVLSFSQALYAENRSHGVLVMAVCPGATKTNFFAVARMPVLSEKLRMQTPQQVVDQALAAYEKRQPVIVTGLVNQLMATASRFTPRTFFLNSIGPLFKKISENAERK